MSVFALPRSTQHFQSEIAVPIGSHNGRFAPAQQPTTKAIKKKQFVPEPVTIEPAPTITNIYGREHRNERVKQKVTKMNTLFVNAI